MAKLKTPDRSEFVERVKVPTASWTFDIYCGLSRERLLDIDPMFSCDYVFGPDGYNVEFIRSKGINYHLLRQGIHEDFIYKGEQDEKYAYDVVFVGHFAASHAPRHRLCKFLERNYKFRWFGKDDPLEIRGHELNKLYSTAKIVVGDSFFSPSYWSNRLYEVLGRGGFLIFQNTLDLNKEYTPYKHFIPYKFNDLEGLKEKIDYYLERPDEREKISLAGMEHTRNHTITKRCQQFLNIINENPISR